MHRTHAPSDVPYACASYIQRGSSTPHVVPTCAQRSPLLLRQLALLVLCLLLFPPPIDPPIHHAVAQQSRPNHNGCGVDDSRRSVSHWRHGSISLRRLACNHMSTEMYDFPAGGCVPSVRLVCCSAYTATVLHAPRNCYQLSTGLPFCARVHTYRGTFYATVSTYMFTALTSRLPRGVVFGLRRTTLP